MDIDLDDNTSLGADGLHFERKPLRVLAATAEEETAHAGYLDELDRACKGRCVWHALTEPEDAA